MCVCLHCYDLSCKTKKLTYSRYSKFLFLLYCSSQSTPSRGVSARQRKNVISCVTVGDSDGEEHRSPAKHQLQQLYQHQQQPPQVSVSVHTPGHTVREIKHEPQHRWVMYQQDGSESSSHFWEIHILCDIIYQVICFTPSETTVSSNISSQHSI